MEQQLDVQPTLSLEHIYLNQSITSKKRALEFISALAGEELHVPAQDVFHALFFRERLGCTKIRGGIAIPHIKLPQDFSPLFICLQLNKPIDFDSLDGQPIDLIFAFIFSEHHADDNKKYLMHFINTIADKTLCKQLRNAKTTLEFHQLLTEALSHSSDTKIECPAAIS